MRKTVVAMIVLCCVTSLIAGPKQRPQLANHQWLIGSWKSTSGGAQALEVWTASSDTSFSGRGCFLRGADTIGTELLTLLANDSGVFYIAQPLQNATPTWFRMVSNDSLGLVFENPQHDYPTRIVYRPFKSDSLHAYIEGNRKGKNSRLDFRFARVK